MATQLEERKCKHCGETFVADDTVFSEKYKKRVLLRKGRLPKHVVCYKCIITLALSDPDSPSN